MYSPIITLHTSPGARQANLNPGYIAKLEGQATYAAPPHVLELRSRRLAPSALPPVTLEELAAHGDGSDDVWTGALGYVVRPKAIFFSSHKGRDLTTRMLMQFHGIPMDDNDDRWVGSFLIVTFQGAPIGQKEGHFKVEKWPMLFKIRFPR